MQLTNGRRIQACTACARLCDFGWRKRNETLASLGDGQGNMIEHGRHSVVIKGGLRWHIPPKGFSANSNGAGNALDHTQNDVTPSSRCLHQCREVGAKAPGTPAPVGRWQAAQRL